VSDVAAGFEFEALLHDAAEAFIGDITRPLKQMLPDFKRIEATVQDAVLKRFGVSCPLPQQIKDADLWVLAAEQRQIMPPGTDSWLAGMTIQPAPIVVRPPPLAGNRQADVAAAVRDPQAIEDCQGTIPGPVKGGDISGERLERAAVCAFMPGRDA
jgi:5'-deoxynucleotidase YfbR-like HD superfamily hydrolase